MQPEPLSAQELAAMPPSMIGSGERAAAGLPHQGAHLNRMLTDQVRLGHSNALTGPAPSSINLLAGRSSPQVNQLAGMPTLPPQAMPSSMPPTMPMAAQPAAQAPLIAPASTPSMPGQAMAGSVGNFVNAGQLSDADLASKADRFNFMQNELRGLIRKPDLDHSDLVHSLANAIKAGVVPASEGAEILGSLPTAAKPLRAELERRHLIALHGAIALTGEQQLRADQTGVTA